MSVSVFVQSIVSAWAIRTALLCSVKLDFRCPKTAQNLPPITTQSTSIFYINNALSPTSTRAKNRQRMFPTGEQTIRGVHAQA